MPRCPHVLRHPLRAAAWFVRTGFGIASLGVLLAVLAAVPVVNVLVLGYLLEAVGRVGRTRRLRDGFPLLGAAPRLGSIALGTWLVLMPVRLLANVAADAAVIDPGSRAARGWAVAKAVVAVLAAGHLLLALARGGSPGCFLRPLKNVLWLAGRLRDGSYWDQAGRSVRDFVVGLRIRHHFLLGLRGYVGSLIWLAVPTALLAFARRSAPGPVLVTVLGGLLLVPVLAWVPFLQARFASTDRFGALFELGAVREAAQRAPLSFFVAVLTTYALSLPLYLFTIAAPPRDALWFETLIFVAFIYPAKLVVGWAYGRGVHRADRAWFPLRWLGRVSTIAVLAVYVFVLFFTQLIGEQGKLVLFEHHALLLPSPF